MLKKYAMPLGIWLLFAAIAVGLWLGLKNIFYLFNFLYIGTGLAAGAALAFVCRDDRALQVRLTDGV